MNRRSVVISLLSVAVVAAGTAAAPATQALPARDGGDAGSAGALPLGSPGLPESRTTTSLAPGVTATRIIRGAFDARTPWVVEVAIPATASSPDPAGPSRSVRDQASAQVLVQRMAAAGFGAAAEPVHQPAVADVPAGVIGHRVRLTGRFAEQATADAAVADLRAAGFSARSWYTGWDGGTPAKGRWTVNVLTIDPRTFRGELGATFGPDLHDRETTTALSAHVGARAAVNGGFFVLDPRSGAPGDPAGAGVYAGSLESETVQGRPALVLDRTARHTRVVRPAWRGSLRTEAGRVVVDGVNRVPGLVRNCGGDATDQPTSQPLHDVTCTDPDELVVVTPAFGPSTPAGAGAEAVLDRQGRVLRTEPRRGTTLQPGQRSVQGTGALAEVVSRLAPGQHVELDLRLTDPHGATLLRPETTVINGGPQLLRQGAVHITQAQDGMVRRDDPSFAYGWVLQRNPRTFAGVDEDGRTLLVTVDGRQPGELGLSIPEAAEVARSLGMREAVNLDGGGSTAMAIGGELVTSPSDSAGERPVGDAIYVR